MDCRGHATALIDALSAELRRHTATEKYFGTDTCPYELGRGLEALASAARPALEAGILRNDARAFVGRRREGRLSS